MIENFRVASVGNDYDALTARMTDAHDDLMDRLDREQGVSYLEADAEWRMDAAKLVRQSVADEFSLSDPTPLFTERREGNLGDTYEFTKLINTLRVVEYSPQSNPQVFTPRKGKRTIKTASHELAYGIPLHKILTGQYKLGDFVSMAGQAITRHYVDLTLTAVDVACASGAVDMRGRPLRTMAAGADVAKSEIDDALRRMYTANTGVTIFGSRWALDPIFDAGAASSDEAKEELHRRGVIGNYRGARLVEIRDDYNMYYKRFTQVNGIDWEKLIFISGGAKGSVLLERDVAALDWNTVDVKKAQWGMGTRFDHGILVHTPAAYHVIQMA